MEKTGTDIFIEEEMSKFETFTGPLLKFVITTFVAYTWSPFAFTVIGNSVGTVTLKIGASVVKVTGTGPPSPSVDIVPAKTGIDIAQTKEKTIKRLKNLFILTNSLLYFFYLFSTN